MAKPQIGIIGNGQVGSALQRGLADRGYEVEATGRDPEKVRQVGERASLLILAVPFSERSNALAELGDSLANKPLVDVTNVLSPDGDFLGRPEQSGAEELQALAPSARVVKAFNTVFAQHMATGVVRGEELSLFVAGDDPEAKEDVLRLGHDLGFDDVDAGPLRNARWLESLGFLNITLGYGQKLGPDSGFRFVHGSKKERPPRPQRQEAKQEPARPMPSRR